jgi:hypothetical protein
MKFKFISTKNKHNCGGKRAQLAPAAQRMAEEDSTSPEEEDSTDGWE